MEEKTDVQKDTKKTGGLLNFLKNLFKKESGVTSPASSGEEKAPSEKKVVSPVQNSGEKPPAEQTAASVQNDEEKSSAERAVSSVSNEGTEPSGTETAASVQGDETEESVKDTTPSVQSDEKEDSSDENVQTTKETDMKKNEELKKLNRLELIEIIYKLKKSEELLQEENEELRNSLDEKVLCMNKAGSIAEAVVGLNHIFETAQRTADEYIASIHRSYAEENGINLQAEIDGMIQDAQVKAEEIISKARKSAAAEKEETLTQAQQEAEEILLSARQEAEKESGEIIARAKQDADEYLDAVMESAESKAAEESTAIIEQATQEAERLRAEFYEEVRTTLRQYPELARRMRG